MAPLHFLRKRVCFLTAILCASLCSLCLGDEARAALDSEAKKPYQLTVVLHIAEHRLLTDVFRDRVEREVRDGLQAALGDLAVVKVVREHPKLAEVLEKGLRSLDGWNDRAAVKTHFVLLDFSGVDYELQARQYDGQTGTATPVVRHEKTQDRDFVARTAVLMVERDFGISAVFQAWPQGEQKPQKVQLELKGSALDAPLDRWVQKGDVFAVVSVPTGNGIGRVVPDAIVQIEAVPGPDHEGSWTGNLFWRRKPPSGAGIAGFRCIKLGAAKGPLKIRIVQLKKDGTPGELLSSPTLLVRRQGFSGENESLLQEKPRDSRLHSYDTTRQGERGLFDKVAFVSIKHDGQIRSEIPIVILDDQPVIVPINLEQNDKTPAERRLAEWIHDVVNSYSAQAETFTELQQLSAKKDTPRATLIAKAKEGAERSALDLRWLKEERAELVGPDKKLTPAQKRDLAQADERLVEIGKGEAELRQYVGRQETIDKEEKDPERQTLKDQFERGKLLERDGELGKAIVIYEKLLDDPKFKNEGLEAHVAQLRELWKPKSAEHRAAREFIYDTWPTLDTASLPMQIRIAQAALNECKKVGDLVGPQKLYRGILIHAARLVKEGEALQDKVGEEDVKQLQTIREIGVNLSKLEAEIKAYLLENEKK